MQVGVVGLGKMGAIAAALFARFSSQQRTSPAMQAIAALRRRVGGHRAEVPA